MKLIFIKKTNLWVIKMDYNEFLLKKRFILESSGFDINKDDLNLMLYDFQKIGATWQALQFAVYTGLSVWGLRQWKQEKSNL